MAPHQIRLTPIFLALAALTLLGAAGPAITTSQAQTPNPFSSEVYLSGLSFPLNLTFAPDGRMFFNERCGDVRVVSAAGVLQTASFADPGSVHCGGDHGLTGLALDPDFATNGYVYIGYVRQISTNPALYKSFVERFTDNGGAGTERTMLIGDLPNKDTIYHGINEIHFGPDGKLYISLGDDWKHASYLSQDLSSPFGKLLRVNKEDGSPPADNPFVNTPGADPRIFAYGFRNSFDYDWHPANGAIYMTENGPSACDELNLVVAGGNYEWPYGFTNLDGDPPVPAGETCEGGVGIPAIHYFTFFENVDPWEHNMTAAPAGIVAIDGDQFPALGDSLLVCTFRNLKLRLLKLGGSNLGDVVQDTWVEEGEGCLVDVAMSPGREIYYTTVDSVRRLIIDSDGDGDEDRTDNCPAWWNPSQALPPWPVSAGDADCDGFSIGVESAAGTNANLQCGVDAWPADISDYGVSDITDVALVGGSFGKAVPPAPARHDIAPDPPDGVVDITDIARIGAFFGKNCSPLP
jgi:glucose/arabinose dehydrogenase